MQDITRKNLYAQRKPFRRERFAVAFWSWGGGIESDRSLPSPRGTPQQRWGRLWPNIPPYRCGRTPSWLTPCICLRKRLAHTFFCCSRRGGARRVIFLMMTGFWRRLLAVICALGKADCAWSWRPSLRLKGGSGCRSGYKKSENMLPFAQKISVAKLRSDGTKTMSCLMLRQCRGNAGAMPPHPHPHPYLRRKKKMVVTRARRMICFLSFVSVLGLSFSMTRPG